jgi:hypothetical protein
MFLMPGRIFSTLSFHIYSVVYSSRELKKYFTTPLRSPFAGLSRYMVGQVYLYWKSYTDTGQMHLSSFKVNMRKKAAWG